MRTIFLLTLGLGMAGLTACSTTHTDSSRVVDWDRISSPRPPQTEGYSQFLIGRYASLTNDPEAAARQYAAVAQNEPDDPIILERAMFSVLLTGDIETARNLVRKVDLRTSELSSLSRLMQGVEALVENRPGQALSILEGGELGNFNRAVADGVAAWAALGAGDANRGLTGLRNLRTGDDFLDGVGVYLLGFLELAADRPEDALVTFDRAWGSGIRLAVGVEAHARLLASRGNVGQARGLIMAYEEEVGPSSLLSALDRDLARGKAIKSPRLSAREGAALAIYAPGAALAHQTRSDLAGVYFTLALALDPELHEARVLLAEAFERGGRPGSAREALRKVPRGSTAYAQARARMAWLAHDRDDEVRAREIAEEALAANPDRNLVAQLGDLYKALRDFETAETLFDRVVEEDARVGRADWRIFYARGAVRHDQGRWEAAEQDFLRALEISPEEPDVLNFLGYSWVDRGENLDEAFRMIQRAIAQRPDAGHIVDSLGWAYFRLGRYQEAIIHLERAVELEPDDPVLNDHLGDAYWMANRRREARFQWDRALSVGAEDALAGRLRQKLDSGLQAPTPVVPVADRP